MKKRLLATRALCILALTAYSQEDAFKTQVADAGSSTPARYLEGAMNNLAGPRNIRDWTIESWIFIPDTATNDAHFLFGTSTAAYNRGFSFELNSNKLFIRLFANGNTFDAFGATTVMPGKWNHVAATFDNTSNVIKLYLNGVQDGTATQTWNYSDINQKFFVGVQPRFKTITRVNSIDEIKIWDYTKTAAEIKTGMTGCQESDAKLVLYYNFEGVGESVVRDKAGNVNLTITGYSNVNTGIVVGQKYCFGDTLFVNHSATGANDGTSWANAYTYLQEAFNNASRADEIWVAKGIYTRTETNRAASFIWQKDDISVYGGFNGTETNRDQRDWVANETILSGDLGTKGTATDNAYCVLTGPYSQTLNNTIANSYVDGIIVQDGYANSTGSDKFGRYGGGFFTESYVNKIEFVNCIFRNNTAVVGGGVNVSSEFLEKEISFTNCKFLGNKARAGAPFDFGTFGKNQQITITGCLIAENEVIDLDGKLGLYGHGGRSMAYDGGNITIGIANTTWANNKDNSSSTDKILLSVHKRFGSGIGIIVLENCIFSNNDHSSNNLSYPKISNNSNFFGRAVNNCLLDNTTDLNSSASLGLIKGDAQFVNSAAGDYSLKATSPAIDKGVQAGLTLPLRDLAGDFRIQGTEIDMGCYEYNPNVSVKEINNTQLTVYPNPSSNILNFENENKVTKKATVIDLTGKKVKEINGNVNSINISDLNNGLYLLQVDYGTSIGQCRFIKN